MTIPSPRTVAASLLAAAALAACRTQPPEPAPAPAPPAGQAAATSPPAAAPPAGGAVRRGYSAADARFVQHMLAHHAQALEMTRLVPERTQRPELHLLAERIDVSQRDEIATMERWLRARGESVPAADGHAGHGAGAAGEHAAMPGMLTADELARLAAARGTAFDRLFLQLMTRHHEGALTMVRELVSAGGAQEPELFQLVSDIEADQRTEIDRMRRLERMLPSQ